MSSKGYPWGLTEKELRILKRLKTPAKIQAFLDTKIAYNHEPKGDTCRSPRVVLREKTAHCIEGSMLAAAALRLQGEKPLLLDLAAHRDHDHVICVFKRNGLWGAVSKSQFNSLQYREPIFRTLRELALSYFSFYYNFSYQKTLRSYSEPVNLSRFDNINWMTSEKDLWAIGEYLTDVPHKTLVTAEQAKFLAPVNKHIVYADRMKAPIDWRARH